MIITWKNKIKIRYRFEKLVAVNGWCLLVPSLRGFQPKEMEIDNMQAAIQCADISLIETVNKRRFPTNGAINIVKFYDRLTYETRSKLLFTVCLPQIWIRKALLHYLFFLFFNMIYPLLLL